MRLKTLFQSRASAPVARERLQILLAHERVRLGPEDLLARARRYVVELAAVAAPGSLRDTKRLVCAHLGLGYPEALRDADRAQWEAIARPDAAEGAASLLERRPPRFARVGDGCVS